MPGWVISHSEASYRADRRDPGFAALVTLSRVVNALRFAAVIGYNASRDTTPSRRRQQFGAFFFTVAVLHEALPLFKRLGKYFRHSAHFKARIIPVLRGPEVTALDKHAIARVRNSAVFHFDEEATLSGLRHYRAPSQVVFASAAGNRKGDVYFELADLSSLYFAVGGRRDKRGYMRRFEALFRQTAAAAIALADAGEVFIGAELAERGWRLQRVRP